MNSSERNRLKIGYFADGKWAHEAFEKLVKDESIEIGFVCVRYDSEDKILKQMAEVNHIDCLKHKNINSQEFIEIIHDYGCDLFVSMSFNQIFKSKIINLPEYKTINCHAGKLPFYRGRNILNWVLINDEKEFGITVHYIDEGIDTGDIILQNTYPITDKDNYNSLLRVAHKECATILYDAIKLIQAGKAPKVSQETIHRIGSYCGMRIEGDEIIDWNQTSRELFNFIRAICDPGPMARSFSGDAEIKINRSEMIEGAPIYKGVAGQVVGLTEDGFIVKTKDSTLKINDYEFDKRIKIGDRFQ